ncbi:MAG: FAD-dependent oxidoreductase [Clostridiaceae bacterium]|nr:FAD-dependent oxidoreductase [Clostridiaceae bacterium]
MEQPMIIIGSSIAGISAAEAARRQNPEIPITILTQDSFLPYYRLRLCEVLDEPAMSGQLTIHPAEWYEQQRIRIETQVSVTAVDPAHHRLQTADNRYRSYDKLIVCSGSQSFIPPIAGINRPGVHTLWLMQSALDLAGALGHASRVAVIGGGLLGLEAAYHIRRRGLPVTILEKAPRLLMNQLDQSGSAVLCGRVRQLDVTVILSADITEILGLSADPASAAAGIRLQDGRQIDADLILVSIGVRAAADFLAGSGIAVQRRILTDLRMQTNLADIYAAGDAAEPEGYWFGLWSSARRQGQVAGINAAGGQAVFERTPPPYVIHTMETHVAVQGDQGLAAEPPYELDVHLDEKNGNYRKLVYRSNNLAGFMLVGNTDDFIKLQKHLGRQGRPPLND